MDFVDAFWSTTLIIRRRLIDVLNTNAMFMLFFRDEKEFSDFYPA